MKIHNNLGHPGVTILCHFIRGKNKNFSLEEVRRVCNECQICRRCKPKYFANEKDELIKVLRPFDRISLDFKGPLPSNSGNKFILIIVDEYSRFPFAYPCRDISAKTIIECLTDLFSIFGLPGYVHTDRGRSFMAKELKDFLLERGVSSSRSTPYHPVGNGQCERYV